MGLVDAFSPEIKVEIKFSDLYNLVKGYTERDIVFKAVKAGVPHRYIRESLSGVSEKQSPIKGMEKDV